MGFKLLHLNLHGLIRSHDLELGRDADTGGQTLYVLELVKGLASRPEVDQVQLVTRLIQDRRVSTDYSEEIETISPGAQIIRIPFGPKRYIKKELLWPYLDDLADLLVERLQNEDTLPDWVHAHYADAGYVGSLISRRLGIPLVFTGHSLGREKQRQLLAAGLEHKQIEQIYSITRRIEAEEFALSHSDLVITSTRQEAEHQYARYGKLPLNQLEVVPPGVDLMRFHPLSTQQEMNEVDNFIGNFLKEPSKSPLLAISRAVRRKNIPALVEAYGRSRVLRQRHNLILVLGCRDDLRSLDKQQRDVFQQIFELVDKYNLYGKIAYPKFHRRDQIPSIYRWAAQKKGLFVNPALTEPFGLTLLEAAACGLPMVATDDGGPKDIQARCQNGLLVDATDLESLQDVLDQAGSSFDQWRRWSDNGIEGVHRNFSWDAHVCNYLALMKNKLNSISPRNINYNIFNNKINKFNVNKLLLLDLDMNIEQLSVENLSNFRNDFSTKKDKKFGIITGLSIKAARLKFAEYKLSNPLVWIARAGTEIYYDNNKEQDKLWQKTISIDWNRLAVENSLADLTDYLVLQDEEQQSKFKVSYLLKEPGKAILPLVRKRLRHHGLAAMPHLRCHWYLDVLPLRASRAEAIRFLSLKWHLSLKDIFVVASEQGDDDLITGLTKSFIPKDHDSSLDKFRSQHGVFFSLKNRASILDGLNHY